VSLNPNSTYTIRCGFAVQQAVQQIHNKSKVQNKSTANWKSTANPQHIEDVYSPHRQKTHKNTIQKSTKIWRDNTIQYFTIQYSERKKI